MPPRAKRKKPAGPAAGAPAPKRPRPATVRRALDLAAHVGAADHSTPNLLLRDHVAGLQTLLAPFCAAGGFVVGCVAWLTHPDLLHLLLRARRAGALVQFVVTKEAYLRQKTNAARRRYDELAELTAAELRALRGAAAAPAAGPEACVRCLGLAGGHRHQARMHHKFVVAGRVAADGSGLQPEVAALGSFNWTANATKSLESVAVLRGPAECAALVREYRQVAAASEPCHYRTRAPAPAAVLAQ